MWKAVSISQVSQISISQVSRNALRKAQSMITPTIKPAIPTAGDVKTNAIPIIIMILKK